MPSTTLHLTHRALRDPWSAIDDPALRERLRHRHDAEGVDAGYRTLVSA